jgi:dipeptidase D
MLEKYEPKEVMRFFEDISKIPRNSGEEKQISDYLVNFAKERGLEVIQDKALNVIIKKPASPGKEGLDPVILQGHLDMVCVKDDELEFDFSCTPLPLTVDGDWLIAKGTSLGADNGIALAMIMAILDDKNLNHPPIEALFTTEEEVGLLGAGQVDGKYLSGKTLINLDSEEEGVFLASCAGGVRNDLKIPYEMGKIMGSKVYEIIIHGLSGGHSGIDINKGRASANVLLARMLREIDDLELISLSGGEKMNSIAKQARAVFASSIDVPELITKKTGEIQDQYRANDNLAVDLKETAIPAQGITRDSSRKIVAILNLIPHGPRVMSRDIAGLVETSSNFGVLSSTDKWIVVENAHRSSVPAQKQELVNYFEDLAVLCNGIAETQGDYPGWQFEKNSFIRELFCQCYEDLTGEEAKIDVIHAGLECGILQERIGKLDMISLGPNMADVHSPKEKLSISSVERTYKLLKHTLEKIN